GEFSPSEGKPPENLERRYAPARATAAALGFPPARLIASSRGESHRTSVGQCRGEVLCRQSVHRLRRLPRDRLGLFSTQRGERLLLRLSSAGDARGAGAMRGGDGLLPGRSDRVRWGLAFSCQLTALSEISVVPVRLKPNS